MLRSTCSGWRLRSGARRVTYRGSVTAFPAAATQASGDPLTEACGDDPGSACRFVFEQTSTEWLAKFVDFLVTRPLKILLIVVLAWVLAKITRRLIRRFTAQLAGSAESGRIRRARNRTPSVLLSQQQPSLRSAARAETISQVLRSLSNAVIYTFAAVYVMAELGLQLGPLIAGAGIAGVALGFGAQSLVRDFLSGMFMLIEDQYGVGDVIDCGEATGTVEAVSLRTTRLRDVNGTVWHVPNGEIRRVGNKSQQWARALLDILVAHDTDVDHANEVLKEVADRVAAEPPLVGDVLEEPEVWGVENLAPEGITLRLVVKTRPGAQWGVMRALRIAIQETFTREGIRMPAVANTVTVQAPAAAPAAPAGRPPE
jgi:small conductance mechanosensitive channel